MSNLFFYKEDRNTYKQEGEGVAFSSDVDYCKAFAQDEGLDDYFLLNEEIIKELVHNIDTVKFKSKLIVNDACTEIIGVVFDEIDKISLDSDANKEIDSLELIKWDEEVVDRDGVINAVSDAKAAGAAVLCKNNNMQGMEALNIGYLLASPENDSNIAFLEYEENVGMDTITVHKGNQFMDGLIMDDVFYWCKVFFKDVLYLISNDACLI